MQIYSAVEKTYLLNFGSISEKLILFPIIWIFSLTDNYLLKFRIARLQFNMAMIIKYPVHYSTYNWNLC